jgi:exodeoxyribonuclease V alpha subunit
MDERYQHLGLSTAWLKFQAARGVHDDPFELRRRLRQIESGAAELNLEPAAVHLAAEIAALEPDLDEQQRLALILLITASLAALQEGSTRLPATGPGEEFGEAGPRTMLEAIAALLEAGEAAQVIGRNPGDYRPLLYLRPFIYHHRMMLAEARLAAMLAARFTAGAGKARQAINAAIADIARRPGAVSGSQLMLSEEQSEGVAQAAANQLALISGGPGTGKTSIILAILRVLVRIGIEPKQIRLAAPTGKAAYRMGESIAAGLEQIEHPAAADLILKENRPEPATIHRLLGYSPGRRRFTYHRSTPLEAAVVIVDEGSMLDLSLMERLVDAIKPEASLILLGDADQLPSVAAGAVFRDLVAAATRLGAQSAAAPAIATRLTHSYRMDTDDAAGRTVFALAQAINSTAAAADLDGAGLARWEGPNQLQFAGVELLSGPRTIEPFLDRWYAARINAGSIGHLSQQVLDQTEQGFDAAAQGAIERVFNHLAASRILCFTRVLGTGAERINAGLHRRWAESANLAAEREFLPGEPVIVTHNDYERMLFNGDQGVVLKVRRPGTRATPMAVFRRGGKFEAFHLPALREALELGYATTIHKAQGSEFDAVAILMPERDLPLLTREALYTGVTRARRSVVIVGQEELLRVGIGRAIERFSGLGEELVRLLGDDAIDRAGNGQVRG